MIKLDKNLENALLSLPRNEVGFSALLNQLKMHRQDVMAKFDDTAKRLVFNEQYRQGALILSGEIEALNDVIKLLNGLIIGGNDG